MSNFALKLKKGLAIAGLLSVVGVASLSVVSADTSTMDNVKGQIVSVLEAPEASAYTFSTASGVVIESADVTAVTNASLVAVGTQYEILKFIGLFLLLGAATWVLTKILGIRIG